MHGHTVCVLPPNMLTFALDPCSPQFYSTISLHIVSISEHEDMKESL